MPAVAFDFLGTLFSFAPVIDRLEDVFGKNVLPMRQNAERLFFQWMWSGLRDYFGSSQAGRYCPLMTVLQSTLTRAMIIEGYAAPSKEQTEKVMRAFIEDIKPAASAIEALELLKKNNWDIWVVTNGAYAGTVSLLRQNEILDYFRRGDEVNVLSCDDLMISKPHPKVYSELMRLNVHRTRRIENFYLVASHAWDLAGAKNVSFRTVFLTTEEKIYPADMYDGVGPDLQGDSILECVQAMIDLEKSKKHFL
ncbi:HAD-like domain-containing protein [Zychaea mexicana]|uniref:HAD-like domain-containing protein n=1 Tax=Zychaea mexicana TaxID=64656 RepID=UPI0022FE6DC4|nr:HAD-like domain-containing protein [Zychaea mexicana]KAI9499026.1 HAD-like domain-containing protein [Zychaea mexicana]